MDHTIASMMDSTIKDYDANFAGTVLHHPEGIDVIPSNIDLSDFETRLVNEFDRENILKNCLAPIKESYDYVFSTNYQQTGRELLTADEVRLLNNNYGLLFIKGERIIRDKKMTY